MRWRYAHGTRGTCVPRCRSYSYCHCGCKEKTSLAKAKSQRWEQQRGEPYIFKSHHYKPAQWSPKKMATCHPDKPHYSGGRCGACHWRRERQSGKLANDPTWQAWERRRYDRFLELIGEGKAFDEALRQLDREVPSRMEEMAQ